MSRLRRLASFTGRPRGKVEQGCLMRPLIEPTDVAPDGISVTLHAAGIRSLVAELADQETPALAASEPALEAAE
jgi:hypothetical protein